MDAIKGWWFWWRSPYWQIDWSSGPSIQFDQMKNSLYSSVISCLDQSKYYIIKWVLPTYNCDILVNPYSLNSIFYSRSQFAPFAIIFSPLRYSNAKNYFRIGISVGQTSWQSWRKHRIYWPQWVSRVRWGRLCRMFTQKLEQYLLHPSLSKKQFYRYLLSGESYSKVELKFSNSS